MKVVSIHRVCVAGLFACGLAASGCGSDDPGNTTLPDGAAGSLAATSGTGGSPLTAAGTGAGAAGITGAAGTGTSPVMSTAGAGGASGGAAAGIGGAAGGGSAAAGIGAVAGASRAAAGVGGAAGGGSVAGSSGAAAGAGGAAAGAGGKGGAGGSSGGSGGAGGAAAGSGGTTTAPTFTEVWGLINTSCNGCHALGQGGLNMMTQAQAYTNLVSAASGQCRTVNRVEPGDAENSVLFLAVSRTSAGSCRPEAMPPGGTKWSQANIDKVKAWIDAGAKND